MQIGEMEISALQEIGNIGASHATTALSDMLDSIVLPTPTRPPVITMAQIPEIIAQRGKVVTIYEEVLGTVEAGILMVIPYFFTNVVVDNVLGMPIEREDPNTISKLGEMDESAMTEIGSILNGHYITSISDFISVSMVCTPPKIGFGTFQNVNLRSKIQYALVIHNELKMEGVDAILGDFFFLPDKAAIDYMMKALGLDMMLAM
ncbi:chemotaxis protein CheC [Candidatus Lokiarchaeum ossiferum]|uniref:chemotaxis protein CheC n=1 Tax=Candidatus Lokiarchaeum ossiferum TaxID=2951803 RepID=UPI00352C2395